MMCWQLFVNCMHAMDLNARSLFLRARSCAVFQPAEMDAVPCDANLIQHIDTENNIDTMVSILFTAE